MTTIYIALLLIANGFFVAAEFALVKVPAVRLESLAAHGNAAARMTVRIAANLEAYLATCQLGITMASLGLGWIGEPAVAALLEPALTPLALSEQTQHFVAFLVGFIVFSSLHIVVGEQVPKTYAIREADKVALWIAYPLHLAYLLSYPLTLLLNIASSSILRLFGVKEVSHVDTLTGAELKDLVDVSKEHGTIASDHAQMIQNVFSFHDQPVARIMLPPRLIAFFDLHASQAEVIDQLRSSGYSRLAVIDGSWAGFCGVILVKELLLRLLMDPAAQPLATHKDLIREPQLVPETQPISDLFQTMQNSHQHMAFAVDEYGEVSGMVTMEDLLEELVGEISDESDTPDQHAAIRSTENGWQCVGLTLLSDLQRVTGIEISSDINANTVTGLFMQRLLRMPKEGDTLEENGHRLEIISMRGRQPTAVQVTTSLASELVANDDDDH